ncbi:MAG: DUF2029 domain-containing protein [Deltaproteobacteria bacterium]|nr:DUF2029 domain-containing protein [Deltaproteobacteria bacterium]
MVSIPPTFRRAAPWVALALATALHVRGLVTEDWPVVKRERHARDFASYHYAVHAAAAGDDPYDAAILGELAQAEGTRKSVHPYFYPPPFLLTMLWALPLTLSEAYRLWFWADSAFFVGAVVAALRLIGPSPAAIWALAGLLLAFTPLRNNHLMGQANLPVLALMTAGLAAAEGPRRREVLGGALVGVAAMMKMSPGLLVAWWLARGRWRAAIVACVTAVLLTVLTLPLLGPALQLHFYRDVLPGFGSGDYHGLKVPLTLFGNHSLPNLWAQVFPAKDGLSSAARLASSVTNLGLVAAGFAALRAPKDGLAVANAVGALSCLMVVVPAYAYEHHLTFLVPAVLASAAALGAGRLPRLAWGPWLLAFVLLCAPLTALKDQAGESGEITAFLLQELKTFAVLLLGALCGIAARQKSSES